MHIHCFNHSIHCWGKGGKFNYMKAKILAGKITRGMLNLKLFINLQWLHELQWLQEIWTLFSTREYVLQPNLGQDPKYIYHTIIRAAFVCLFVCLCVCSLSPPRSFDGSSPNLVAVCRLTSHLPLKGSFSKRSMGRWVNGSLSLSTILYMRQPYTTQLQKAPFALLAQLQSLIRHLLLHCMSTAYVGGPRNCYWGVLFLKGQRVDGSTGQTGQRVTFTFTILCMIADDSRLTPPRCKKHMVHDDTRLTPHRCKKHTVSFARSTGKFPSKYNS